mmetsp:Transcript_22491/g.64679  ORF Transcript_22491/g.64679 Transcript_22491/m.64679 type:complete len:113 (-) Transcript_22491:116-454(-)
MLFLFGTSMKRNRNRGLEGAGCQKVTMAAMRAAPKICMDQCKQKDAHLPLRPSPYAEQPVLAALLSHQPTLALALGTTSAGGRNCSAGHSELEFLLTTIKPASYSKPQNNIN